MKLCLENLPVSLHDQREVLIRCLDAFKRLTPVRRVYLFGSHARGDARWDNDVDLCIVAEGAERQQETARRHREAICCHPHHEPTDIPQSYQRRARRLARHVGVYLHPIEA